jgi:hypothetical protein
VLENYKKKNIYLVGPNLKMAIFRVSSAIQNSRKVGHCDNNGDKIDFNKSQNPETLK